MRPYTAEPGTELGFLRTCRDPSLEPQPGVTRTLTLIHETCGEPITVSLACAAHHPISGVTKAEVVPGPASESKWLRRAA
jgi:hypothetical protein